jgi:hypothetical protein
MYEIFTRKTPRMGSPILSFSKIGQISFNQTAARLLQKEAIEHILLLWDSTEHKLALKSINNKKDPRAYRIRYNEKGNGASFSAKTFLDHAGIDYSERKAIPIEINPSAEMFLEVTLPDTVLKNTSKRATLQTEYSNIGRT